MKFSLIGSFAAILIMALVSACGGGSTKSETATDAGTSESDAPEMTYSINTGESTVRWEGKVVNVYGHYGLIDIKEGSVMAKGSQLTGGEVVIDMTTILPTDSSSYDEVEKMQKLIDHLSTGDFFLVEEHPTASFVIKSHEGNKVTGDLTIRGNTHEETIEIESMEASESGMMAKGKLVFDRQKYDVKWEHQVKDYVLSDDIELEFTIKGTTATS